MSKIYTDVGPQMADYIEQWVDTVDNALTPEEQQGAGVFQKTDLTDTTFNSKRLSVYSIDKAANGYSGKENFQDNVHTLFGSRLSQVADLSDASFLNALRVVENNEHISFTFPAGSQMTAWLQEVFKDDILTVEETYAEVPHLNKAVLAFDEGTITDSQLDQLETYVKALPSEPQLILDNYGTDYLNIYSIAVEQLEKAGRLPLSDPAKASHAGGLTGIKESFLKSDAGIAAAILFNHYKKPFAESLNTIFTPSAFHNHWYSTANHLGANTMDELTGGWSLMGSAHYLGDGIVAASEAVIQRSFERYDSDPTNRNFAAQFADPLFLMSATGYVGGKMVRDFSVYMGGIVDAGIFVITSPLQWVAQSAIQLNTINVGEQIEQEETGDPITFQEYTQAFDWKKSFTESVGWRGFYETMGVHFEGMMALYPQNNIQPPAPITTTAPQVAIHGPTTMGLGEKVTLSADITDPDIYDAGHHTIDWEIEWQGVTTTQKGGTSIEVASASDICLKEEDAFIKVAVSVSDGIANASTEQLIRVDSPVPPGFCDLHYAATVSDALADNSNNTGDQDIVILLDASSSMGGFQDLLKRDSEKIFKNLAENLAPQAKGRVSLAIYGERRTNFLHQSQWFDAASSAIEEQAFANTLPRLDRSMGYWETVWDSIGAVIQQNLVPGFGSAHKASKIIILTDSELYNLHNEGKFTKDRAIALAREKNVKVTYVVYDGTYSWR